MTSETTPALVRKLMSRQDLTRAESAELLEDLLRHDTEGWKLLAYSVASQTKGETVDELLGIWDAMYRLTGDYDLDLKGRRPMEVASAGSSGVRKINVSTLMALVVGEPAVPVLKHSFWKITGIAGSADVLASVASSLPRRRCPSSSAPSTRWELPSTPPSSSARSSSTW